MPWLPVLKAVLPYIGNIVSAAMPVFTARRDKESADLTARQIAELQDAVTQNAETIKLLASQLQETITALDKEESELAQRQESLLKLVEQIESLALQARNQSSRHEDMLAAMQARFAEAGKGATRLRNLVYLALVLAVLALLLAAQVTPKG